MADKKETNKTGQFTDEELRKIGRYMVDAWWERIYSMSGRWLLSKVWYLAIGILMALGLLLGVIKIPQ